MKKIAILGSTGSIGTSTLRVIKERPRDFRIVGLSAYRNVRLLAEQIKVFKPKLVSVKDEQVIKQLEQLVDLSGVKVYTQEEGMVKIAACSDVELIVVATVGIISLLPVLEAIERGKIIALANKEPLVMAGEIVMDRLKKSKSRLIPVDSEHSAVFQCLRKENPLAVKRIILTASGGPFYDLPRERFKNITLKMALRHPKWKMGKKITIDSATMMNKGLELIEAGWLFDIPAEKIEIVIHPEAVIHSMVEFCDRSIIAQLGITDMRLPIQYALDYPERRNNNLDFVDFFKVKSLTFVKPDVNKFPCFLIARKAAEAAGSNGCVMNAANEVAVEAFLCAKIGFMEIANIISRVLKKHTMVCHPTLDEIFAFDAWARREARLLCYPQ